MQPAYYEDLAEIQNKYWSMLDDAVTNRSSPFRIPVFICAHQNEVDGRIVVLRKSDRKNNILQLRLKQLTLMRFSAWIKTHPRMILKKLFAKRH